MCKQRLQIFLLWLILIGVGAAPTPAALLLYEPFNYPNGTLFGKNMNTNGWGMGDNLGADGDVATNGAALAYPGLVTTAGSAGLLVAGTPSVSRNVGNTNFPPQTLRSNNPSIYLSFLLNVQSPTSGTNTRMLASLYCQDSDVGAIAGAGVAIDAANRLYVTKKSNTPDTSPTAPLSAGTHLVVVRYRASSGDHPASLWVDPPNLGLGESNVPPANASTSGHDNVSGTFRAAYIYQAITYSGTYYIDELRVGTNWADVTPVFIPQVVSAANSLITISTAATNLNSPVLVTVAEFDANNNAMTNAGSAPILNTTLGTLDPVTSPSNGVFTATLTCGTPGYATVYGTIDGAAIGGGAGVSVYFAGPVGTNGTFTLTPQPGPGHYFNIGFASDPGQTFSVWSTTNPGLPMAQWNLETDLANDPSTTMFETTHSPDPSTYSLTVKPPTSGPIFYRVSSP